jgi:hypothetical protein
MASYGPASNGGKGRRFSPTQATDPAGDVYRPSVRRLSQEPFGMDGPTLKPNAATSTASTTTARAQTAEAAVVRHRRLHCSPALVFVTLARVLLHRRSLRQNSPTAKTMAATRNRLPRTSNSIIRSGMIHICERQTELDLHVC